MDAQLNIYDAQSNITEATLAVKKAIEQIHLARGLNREMQSEYKRDQIGWTEHEAIEIRLIEALQALGD